MAPPLCLQLVSGYALQRSMGQQLYEYAQPGRALESNTRRGRSGSAQFVAKRHALSGFHAPFWFPSLQSLWP